MWKASPMAWRGPAGPPGPGEIAVVGDHPERGAVAGHDRLSCPRRMRSTDGVGLRPAIDGQRNLRVAIGQRGADDGDRETLFAIGPQQALLAGDLVARILPVGVGQRRRFGDQIVRRRLLVGAGGADEDVLPGAAAEQRAGRARSAPG